MIRPDTVDAEDANVLARNLQGYIQVVMLRGFGRFKLRFHEVHEALNILGQFVVGGNNFAHNFGFVHRAPHRADGVLFLILCAQQDQSGLVVNHALQAEQDPI